MAGPGCDRHRPLNLPPSCGRRGEGLPNAVRGPAHPAGRRPFAAARRWRCGVRRRRAASRRQRPARAGAPARPRRTSSRRPGGPRTSCRPSSTSAPRSASRACRAATAIPWPTGTVEGRRTSPRAARAGSRAPTGRRVAGCSTACATALPEADAEDVAALLRDGLAVVANRVGGALANGMTPPARHQRPALPRRARGRALPVLRRADVRLRPRGLRRRRRAQRDPDRHGSPGVVASVAGPSTRVVASSPRPTRSCSGSATRIPSRSCIAAP